MKCLCGIELDSIKRDEVILFHNHTLFKTILTILLLGTLIVAGFRKLFFN